MKKFILSIALLLGFVATYAQSEKTNGTIYIKHPYIDVINKSSNAYQTKNITEWTALYADTAKFSFSWSDKTISLKEEIKLFGLDYKFFDKISVKTYGYPDYLHYVEEDSKVVQSWWTWSGTSKKTGKVIKVLFVMFDWFNADGKIVLESTFGDFSKLNAELGTK